MQATVAMEYFDKAEDQEEAAAIISWL